MISCPCPNIFFVASSINTILRNEESQAWVTTFFGAFDLCHPTNYLPFFGLTNIFLEQNSSSQTSNTKRIAKMPPARPEQRMSRGSGVDEDGSVETPPRDSSATSSSSKKKVSGPVTHSGLRFPDAYMEIENKNEIPMWLAPCNFTAAIFDLMQAVFIFAFSTKVDMKWCVYTFYPDPNNDVHETDIYAVPGQQEVGCFSVTWYAGISILLSGIGHILCVIPPFRKKYEYNIARHQSPQRWYEYCLSCPLMRVHIAQIAGVTDLYTLILTFFLGHAAVVFPILYEKINAKNRADGYVQDTSPFWMGVTAHMASWAVVFAYFANGSTESNHSLALTLVCTLFALELTFPLVFALQWGKVGPFKDYMIGEFAFCLLSFTTKTFLAWTTLIGANAYARKG
jgi:hypothetical protein